VKYTVIESNLYLMVRSIVLKFEKIWLSHTLIIIRKPKKFLFSKRKRLIRHNSWTVNVKYTVIKLNLYFMLHSNVWKFENIWLSGTLIIIRKPKVWRTDGHEDPYIPQTLVERGYNEQHNCIFFIYFYNRIYSKQISYKKNSWSGEITPTDITVS
jgi:hypothetical protein